MRYSLMMMKVILCQNKLIHSGKLFLLVQTHTLVKGKFHAKLGIQVVM